MDRDAVAVISQPGQQKDIEESNDHGDLQDHVSAAERVRLHLQLFSIFSLEQLSCPVLDFLVQSIEKLHSRSARLSLHIGSHKQAQLIEQQHGSGL